jgi:hypothetical protein
MTEWLEEDELSVSYQKNSGKIQNLNIRPQAADINISV